MVARALTLKFLKTRKCFFFTEHYVLSALTIYLRNNRRCHWLHHSYGGKACECLRRKLSNLSVM